MGAWRGEGPELINSARDSLEGHLMSFAAEESRLNNGAVIDMAQFRAKAEAATS